MALAVANREIVTVSFDPFSRAEPAFLLRAPLFVLVFVLVICWIVVNAFMTSPVESVATLVLILLGVPLYPLFHGKSTASKSPPAPEQSR